MQNKRKFFGRRERMKIIETGRTASGKK